MMGNTTKEQERRRTGQRGVGIGPCMLVKKYINSTANSRQKKNTFLQGQLKMKTP